MTTFAETYQGYPDGQQNVNQPPDAVLNYGFVPATSSSRGQPLPAQWLNWLMQKLFRLANRDKVTTDAAGPQLFNIPQAMIELTVIDKSDPNKYLFAVGWKSNAGVAHALKVVSSSGITLGAAGLDGSQPVSGATSPFILAKSRQIGDI